VETTRRTCDNGGRHRGNLSHASCANVPYSGLSSICGLGAGQRTGWSIPSRSRSYTL
jgi:hypothetical protein